MLRDGRCGATAARTVQFHRPGNAAVAAVSHADAPRIPPRPSGQGAPRLKPHEAMAANGKVAVDKLKIGATVSIKLKDSGSCEGAVYTVDPITRTVVLFSAAEKPVTQDSRDVRLVPEHAIDSIKVVKPPDAKDKKALVAPLPAIDVAACKKRESEAYEAMEAAMAMLNPNA